ncbi:MAG: hypothetical protein ACLRPW_12195 [Intestinibacter sp.]
MRDKVPNYKFNGIESPGLTSSTPIAKYVVSLLNKKKNLQKTKTLIQLENL